MEHRGSGKETVVSTIAAGTEKLRELDDDTRRAWDAYRERTRTLAGESYEYAELESWTILQNELRRLERRRRLMTDGAA
jgi:hypothetical protein